MGFGEYYKQGSVVDSYDKKRLRGVKSKVTRKLEREFIRELVKGGKILEAGVGTGYISEVLIELGDFEGFDISPVMINKIRDKIKGVRVSEKSILSLTTDKRYDVVVSIRVISHFHKDDALKALRNLSRVLRRGGNVIFNLENKSILRRTARKVRRWGSTYTYQYSDREVDSLLKEAGLKVIEKKYVDHLFLYPIYVLNRVLGGLLEKRLIELEKRLSGVRFASNNILLKCQK